MRGDADGMCGEENTDWLVYQKADLNTCYWTSACLRPQTAFARSTAVQCSVVYEPKITGEGPIPKTLTVTLPQLSRLRTLSVMFS